MADELTPITRLETALAGGDLTPITRLERILAGEDLEPITRLEWFVKTYAAGGDTPSGGGTNLAAVDVFVGDYLSATELVVTTGAVNRYQRYIVGN